MKEQGAAVQMLVCTYRATVFTIMDNTATPTRLEAAVWTFISLCAVRKQSTMAAMVSVGVACVVCVAIGFVSQYSFAQEFY